MIERRPFMAHRTHSLYQFALANRMPRNTFFYSNFTIVYAKYQRNNKMKCCWWIQFRTCAIALPSVHPNVQLEHVPFEYIYVMFMPMRCQLLQWHANTFIISACICDLAHVLVTRHTATGWRTYVHNWRSLIHFERVHRHNVLVVSIWQTDNKKYETKLKRFHWRMRGAYAISHLTARIHKIILVLNLLNKIFVHSYL